MKFFNNILKASLGVLLLTGCSDFLDSNPITSLVESNYYKTEKDAQTALIGCYDGLQNIYTKNDLPTLLAPIIMADECFGGTGTGDGYGFQLIDEFDYQRSLGDVNMYNSVWASSYQAIYRCNMLLSKMDQIEWVSQATRNQVEAEARFIRAYIYFDLGKLLGNIPLVTRPVTKEEANIPQASPEELYGLIESDLLFAAENGLLNGDKWTSDWGIVNDGRATAFAAKAMLARVWLYYTGYHNKTSLPNGTSKQQIVTALQEVYASGHGLVDKYNELWPAASSERDATAEPIKLKTSYVGEGNQETVWSIKFNSSGEWGNFDGFSGMRIIGMRSGSIKSFGNTVYGDGSWGGAPVNSKFVSDWKAAEPGDPRLGWSVIDMATEGIIMSDKHDQREYTGYFPKKYICMGNGTDNIYVAQGLDFQWNQYTDLVVIRYADVLLMLSELTEDAQYLNQVRTRVGLAPVSYTAENLRKERKHEFAFEGVRYWDLLRYDHTLDYAANAIAFSGKVINGAGDKGSDKVIDGKRFKATKGLSQIPNTQISLSNGVLKQNEGWSN
jgi:starch-binding outer membrane protein, SusD/RagB family